MKEITIQIDYPELETELELDDYEPKPVRGFAKLSSIYNDPTEITFTVKMLAKPKPLPEPDWSKLGMLKSGTWVTWSEADGWIVSNIRPTFGRADWNHASCSWGYLDPSLFHFPAFPEIPADRWQEACWMVP